MKTITTKKANKLFYKKYKYKIEFGFPIGDIFRTYYQTKGDLSYAKTRIEDYREQLKKKSAVILGIYNKVKLDVEDVNDAEVFMNALLSLKEYMYRKEFNYNSILYCNDLTILDTIKNLKTSRCITLHEVRESVTNLNEREYGVLASKKHGEYEFKVTLNMYQVRRKNPATIQWIKANRDKVKISDYSVEHACSNVGIYVRDEKVLLLLRMTGDQWLTNIERLVPIQ